MMLLYLLKVSTCTAIFFAGYQFLFSKLTFFKWNRMYLLFCLALSFIIPTLSITHETTVLVHHTASGSTLPYSNEPLAGETFAPVTELTVINIDWMQCAGYAYLIVAVGLFIRTLWMMLNIQKVLKKHRRYGKENILFVSPESGIKNCSFLTQIIIDASLSSAEQDLVIKHESIHVIQRHALDKVYVNIAVCLLWFNPVIYLWRNAIDHNHEFLADEATAKTVDKKHYASLLLHLAMPVNQMSIHNFSKLPLKNRIAMMYQKPNSTIKKISYLALFPLVAICCVAFVSQKNVQIRKMITDQSAQLNQEAAIVKQHVKATSENEKEEHNIQSGTAVKNGNKAEADVKVLPNRSFDNGIEMGLQAENVLDSKLRSVQSGKEQVLVIDAGHGGKDGATASAEGEKEKDLNLRVAVILQEEADRRHIKVVLIRSTDKFIALRDRLPSNEATAFISIHHNSMPVKTVAPYRGIEAIVASKSNPYLDGSERFASNVIGNLSKLKGMEVRQKLKSADLFLLRESKVPSIVLELGNVGSMEDMNYLRQDENIRKICNLILDGFIDFSGC